MQMAGIGLESRNNILPTPKVPGILGPDYSYADNVKLPGQVGVRDGDSIDSVIDSLKAASYYIDTIGFGQSSNQLSADRGVKPLGVNVWIRTGFTCSNGAEMWSYMQGIPQGTAFGSRVAKGLSSAGLPQLRGLAPGIMEDVQDALDPSPVMNALFGTGFPFCSLEKKRVGDQDGNIYKLDENGNKVYYIQNPETAVKDADGFYYQSRWVRKGDLTQGQWDATPKTYCPSGIRKQGKCPSEGFQNDNPPWKEFILVSIAAAGIFSLMYYSRKK